MAAKAGLVARGIVCSVGGASHRQGRTYAREISSVALHTGRHLRQEGVNLHAWGGGEAHSAWLPVWVYTNTTATSYAGMLPHVVSRHESTGHKIK